MVLSYVDSSLIIPKTVREFSILNPLKKNMGTHYSIFDYFSGGLEL